MIIPRRKSWGNVLSSSRRSFATQSKRRRDNNRVRLEDLEVTGSTFMTKPNKITRLFYENINGLNHTWKVRWLNALRNTLSLNLICGTELNRKKTTYDARSLAEDIFSNTPYIQTVSSFNHHEQGCTYMATGGKLATKVARTGTGFTSLGRWSWVLVGRGDRFTCIVTAYQPCRSSNVWHSTFYNKQCPSRGARA